MGRKRKSDEPRATPSRSSARLASKPKIEEPETPKSETPKPKRTPRKQKGDQVNDSDVQDESPNVSLEVEKGDEETKPESAKKRPAATDDKVDNDEPSAKENKLDDSVSPKNSPKTAQLEKNGKPSEDTEDFVVVKPNDVPAPESNEVQEAIKAQGEDANLLVNFVQVSKEELPAADSEEVAKSLPQVVEAHKPATSVPEKETNHGKDDVELATGQENSLTSIEVSPVVKDNGVAESAETVPSKLSTIETPGSKCTTDST